MKKTQRLTETAIMLALASILSLLSIINMPFGGNVSAFSMLPIAVIAFRYKTAWGIFTGFVYGLLQMLLGMQNLTYATSPAAVVAIVLLDYLVAFAVLGFAGIFRRIIKDNGTAFALGTFVGCALRYVCHVISGCTVWAGVSIPSSDGLIYSLAYNAAYMVPETLLTVVAAYYAGKAFTLTSDKIVRVPVGEGVTAGLYSALPLVLSVVIGFVLIFSMMQTEEGFDITGISTADVFSWIRVLIVFAVGAAASVCVAVFHKLKKRAA